MKEKAIMWWEKLPSFEKSLLYTNYSKENFTMANNLEELTLNEIVDIYQDFLKRKP